MVDLYLFRHGQTDWNIENRCQGHIVNVPIPLNESGINQVKNIIPILRQSQISCIYSSDLERAKQTSDVIIDELDIPIYLDKRLRETNFGDLQGNLPEDNCMYFDRFSNHKLSFPGGESIADQKKRFKECLIEISNACEDNSAIGISSHGGPIGNLISDLCNAEYRALSNAEVVHIKYDGLQFIFIEYLKS